MKASLPRLALWAAILAAAALLATKAGQGSLGRHQVVITQKQIQERLDAMAPIQGRKWMARIELPDPKARLVEDSGEIELGSSVTVELPRWGSRPAAPLLGHATLRGRLRYDAPSGSLYLDQPQIIELTVDKAPEKYQSKIKELAQGTAAKYLAAHPIYVVEDPALREALAKNMLRSVKVQDQTIVATLGLF